MVIARDKTYEHKRRKLKGAHVVEIVHLTLGPLRLGRSSYLLDILLSNAKAGLVVAESSTAAAAEGKDRTSAPKYPRRSVSAGVLIVDFPVLLLLSVLIGTMGDGNCFGSPPGTTKPSTSPPDTARATNTTSSVMRIMICRR